MADETQHADAVRRILSKAEPKRIPGITIHAQNVFVIGDQHAELLRQLVRSPCPQPKE